jgi:hypothetical protein
MSAVPWRASGGNLWARTSPDPEIPDVHIGGMSTPALAELVAAEHNAELMRRKAAQPGQSSLPEVFSEGVPEGATVSAAQEETMLPRTWVKLHEDGTEIYLDADEPARFLVRTVQKGIRA